MNPKDGLRKLPAEKFMSDSAKILSQRTVFDGYHRLDIVSLQPKSLKHDGWAEKMEREVLICNRVASALLYIPETDEILLNQQFRVGALLAGASDPFLFECAAGAIDDGETPEDAARREALEETGCKVTDLESLGVVYSSPGCLSEAFHLFIGRIEKAAHGIYGMEEEGEEIKTHLLPAGDVIRMLDEGRITNATTALVLNWFARNKDKLRQKWNRKAA